MANGHSVALRDVGPAGVGVRRLQGLDEVGDDGLTRTECRERQVAHGRAIGSVVALSADLDGGHRWILPHH